MKALRTLLLSILNFIFVLNLTAQVSSMEVFVYDDYTENPLESALVTLLKNGEVIDSSYTNESGIANINLITTSIRERDPEGLPTTISLSHNYPNPFRDETNVEIGVPEAQTITANIYNILGQRVASEQLSVTAGYHSMKISLGNLPHGVYFLRVVGNESETTNLLKMGNGILSSNPGFTITSGSSPNMKVIDKLTEDELTLKVVKERYKHYESSITTSGYIDIPLALSHISDIDGNDYEVIKIGEQWLMAKNLRSRNYNDGSPIPRPIADSEWASIVTGGYAVYPHENVDGIDSEEEMADVYGMLYNWYAVADARNLCPTGWHVPSDNDWKQFEMFLGMSQTDANGLLQRGTDQGGKMKSTRTDPDTHPRWISPNTGAADTHGFSGFAAGARWYHGGFREFDPWATWWSASQQNVEFGFVRTVFHNDGRVGRIGYQKTGGFSIRCFRD